MSLLFAYLLRPKRQFISYRDPFNPYIYIACGCNWPINQLKIIDVLVRLFSMEYKPLDLNKFCSAIFMGLSVVNLYQNISVCNKAGHVSFSLRQLQCNINIAYTSTKISLFKVWSFESLFLYLVCMSLRKHAHVI